MTNKYDALLGLGFILLGALIIGGIAGVLTLAPHCVWCSAGVVIFGG